MKKKKSLKTTVRLRPCELTVIDAVAVEFGLTRNRIIRYAVFGSDDRANAIRTRLEAELAPFEFKQETRVVIGLAIGADEVEIFRELRKKCCPFVNLIRYQLACRQISFRFSNAAFASAKHGRIPVLTPERIASYKSLVQAYANLAMEAAK